jgi:hypothetical protein
LCNPVSVFFGNGVVVAWWEFCRRGRHVRTSAALPVFWHAALCTTCFARCTTCFAREVPGSRLNPLTARPVARLFAPYLACDRLPHGPCGESRAAVEILTWTLADWFDKAARGLPDAEARPSHRTSVRRGRNLAAVTDNWCELPLCLSAARACFGAPVR